MTMPYPVEPPRALRLVVDSEALADNWRTLSRLSGAACAGAAVKANAYGVGVAQAMPALRDAGARDFFVAQWCEVADVLAHVAPQHVSVLHGLLHGKDAEYARATGVRPVINSLAQARIWLDAGGGPCDLMVDTGMNRLGLPMDALGDPLVARLDVDTLHSHLASADEESPFNETQRIRFVEACAAIPARRRSLANSAGITLGRAYHFDLTRPGLSLYGGVPCPALDGRIRQVVRPHLALLQVRDLPEGATVGYNATFTAPRPMRVGVISLGYADGYLRCWSDKGSMLSRGRKLPVLGRVSMDMTVIDITHAPELREGDWVEASYSLPEGAALSGLSQYELLTLLGNRFQRG